MLTTQEPEIAVIRKDILFLEIDADGKLCHYTTQDDPLAEPKACKRADQLTDWDDYKVDLVNNALGQCVGVPEGYQYEFRFSDPSRSVGDAQVLFKRFGGMSSKWHAERLAQLKLGKRNIIAHLNELYPNGRKGERQPQHERQGVGTRALDTVVNDAANRGAKAMYVGACSREFGALLHKLNWSYLNGIYAKRIA